MLSTTSSAFAQSVGTDDYLDIGLPDSQEILRRLKDYELLRQMDKEKDKTIENLEGQIANLNRVRELDKRETEIYQKMLELKEKEIAGINKNFDQMKEIADRATKLAEVSKPKSNWQLYGLAAIVGYVINELIHR